MPAMHPPRLLVLLTLGSFAASGLGAESGRAEPVEGSAANPIQIDIPDSARTTHYASEEEPFVMPTQEVRARRVVRESGADRVEISPGMLESRDGASVADLGSLLPSTHLSTNSRGEALFMVRGSSERHLAVELDGIPLTVPWDERTDLSMLPLVGIGSVEAQRGVASVLDSPNALAGMVRLQTRLHDRPGSHTRVGGFLTEVEGWGSQLLHERQDGDWQTTVALEHRTREGFLLPQDFSGEFHQGDRRTRTNSDLEQTSALLTFRNQPTERVDWRAIVQASQGEKGVPPETHLDEGARFWRYPERERLLVGVRGTLRSAEEGAWSVTGLSSLDFFEQEIRPFEDSDYRTPALDQGVDYESDDDRTFLSELRGEMAVGGGWTLRSRGRLRLAEHRESLVFGGPENEYTQALGAAGVEAEWNRDHTWSVRAGVGYEGAATPDTGDKPDRAADHELAAQFAVEHAPTAQTRWYASLSRRPRFPSLREMFSGALGRFQVNPDLRPERQDALELGGSWSGSSLDLMANFFWQELDGGIERVQVGDSSLRQRVNLDSIRNLGSELGLVWRAARGLTFDWQHTFLYSRREAGGDFDRRVEDRPDWLSTLAADYVHPVGLRLRLELAGIGDRWSFDERPTAGEDDLTRLETDLRTNLRLSWRHFGVSRWYEGAELYLRVDNLFDETTFSQLGLPESGRTLRVGVRVDLQS